MDDQVREVERRKQVGFVKVDYAEIGLLADGDLADVVASKRLRSRRDAKALRVMGRLAPTSKGFTSQTES